MRQEGRAPAAPWAREGVLGSRAFCGCASAGTGCGVTCHLGWVPRPLRGSPVLEAAGSAGGSFWGQRRPSGRWLLGGPAGGRPPGRLVWGDRAVAAPSPRPVSRRRGPGRPLRSLPVQPFSTCRALFPFWGDTHDATQRPPEPAVNRLSVTTRGSEEPDGRTDASEIFVKNSPWARHSTSLWGITGPHSCPLGSKGCENLLSICRQMSEVQMLETRPG
ncbi:uncharacterized protein LOC119871273 isoform X1 [Canis lupus familiaris]|uniref:uncharacterized protein LOC119871273 isoform X1 n=1 Tax=Canis lupus familiaris TaxID=9615 RepID=UPI0018F7DE4F|nr:uncharacterized protein LOC119871273 isoform X1 [Canis lupus familiaris]